MGGCAGGVRHIAIIGAGIAGISALEAIGRTAGEAQTTVISNERELPYYRLNLTRYLAGEVQEEGLPLHLASWYAERGGLLRLGEEVVEVRPAERELVLGSREVLPYDKLILAAGAHPFIPPIAGAQRDGVFTMRTIGDARALLSILRPGVQCVCLGGGTLGLEIAAALTKRGAEVTVVEVEEWLMPRQLNRRAGDVLAAHLRSRGIELLTGTQARAFTGDKSVTGVVLEDGTHRDADCVVIATGVQPNSDLARRAGLAVSHGVVVDDRLMSSHPDVLAAGDVAEHRGVLYGTWSASQHQGRIAGMNAAGAATEFVGIPRSNMLKVVGVGIFTIGIVEPEGKGSEIVEDEADDRYARFVFHDGRLVGAVLLGDTSAAGPVRKAIESGQDRSSLLRTRPTATQVAEHLRGT